MVTSRSLYDAFHRSRARVSKLPKTPHTSPHLPTPQQDTVSALDTCQAALQALHACTRSLETDLQLLEEAGVKAAGAVK